MPNGNAVALKAVAGILTGSGLLGFMGYGIVNNDIRNTGQHIEIRKEIIIGDKENRERIAAMKEIVSEIRIEQKSMAKDISMILEKVK